MGKALLLRHLCQIDTQTRIAYSFRIARSRKPRDAHRFRVTDGVDTTVYVQNANAGFVVPVR